jgi:hypothetical protein
MNWYDTMTIDLPECESDGLKVERFTIEPNSIHNFRLGARATRPGTYTGLLLNGRLWMSDTDAEKHDHMAAIHAMRNWEAKRVLINGLGLGMVLKAALAYDHVEHVDVVELDERVIRLVGSHYAKDPRVHLHQADAYEQMARWPEGSRWDVVWSDIWPDLCTDNLKDMTRLRRSYGRRSHWNDCWGRDVLLPLQRRERAEERQREIMRGWLKARLG